MRCNISDGGHHSRIIKASQQLGICHDTPDRRLVRLQRSQQHLHCRQVATAIMHTVMHSDGSSVSHVLVQLGGQWRMHPCFSIE